MTGISPTATQIPALIQQDLYFGRSLSNNKSVSASDFHLFIDDVITPRFSSGLTLSDGRGQLLDDSGTHETTNIVTLYAEDTLESQIALNQVAQAYRERFGVGIFQVTNKDDLKVGFGIGENLIDNDVTPELIQVDLFFGRNIGGIEGVTPEQFQTFVDTAITPRFPLGLTNFDANGQFLSSNGALIREPSEVVSLILEDTEANEAEIDAIVLDYIQQFQQESVLISVNEDITVAFGVTEDLIDNDPIPEPIQVDLFFGRNIGGVEGVSEAAFQQFLDEVVDPYFNNFTVIDAKGQFLSGSGDLIQERSKGVSFIIEDTVANETAINQVVAEYIERFQQESVLIVVDEDIQANFIGNRLADSLIDSAGINLLDFAEQCVQTTISILAQSVFDHQGGLYTAIDAYGTVVDPLTGCYLAPGETGYAEAALRQTVQLLNIGSNSFDLIGGYYYVPYLLADSNSANFYTPFATANADGLPHTQFALGQTFRFEDLFGLGDRSFNDFVIQVDITPSL